MVKDHADSERGNPLPPHGLLFSISSMDSTYHSLLHQSWSMAGMRNSSMGPPCGEVYCIATSHSHIIVIQ